MEGYVNTSRKNGERTASSYERGYLNIEEVTRELSESKSMIVKTRKKLQNAPEVKARKQSHKKIFTRKKIR